MNSTFYEFIKIDKTHSENDFKNTVSDTIINFHEEPLDIKKLDASSREAGQDSDNK
jgi:hypothetical protein